MKLNAVAVASSNIEKSVTFYKILGFTFPEIANDEQHVESIIQKGETKLMIDTKSMIKDILQHEPVAANHSTFAIEYDTPQEIDTIVSTLRKNHFTVAKEPWDAFWGQHYAVVQDPDGYMVDLFGSVKPRA